MTDPRHLLLSAACFELLLVRFTGGPVAWPDLVAAGIVWLVLAQRAEANPARARSYLAVVGALWATPALLPAGLPLAVGAGLVTGALTWTLQSAGLALVSAGLILWDGGSLLPWLGALPALVLPWTGRPLLAWVLLGAAVTPAWRARQSGPDVVVVTVDALRRDALDDMPNVRGTRFAGVANAPWTLPSMASLQRGVTPSVHGAGRDGEGFRGPSGGHPLAVDAATAGYRTVAVSAGNVFTGAAYGLLDGYTEVHHPWAPVRHPFPRGRAEHATPRPVFARWYPPRPRGQDVTALARKTRQLLDRPGADLVWLHLMEVHLPYREAPCRAETLTADGARVRLLEEAWWRSDEGLNCLREAYTAQVAAVDDALAPLFEREDTWVILTADHGEALGDDGLEHGHTLHPSVTEIPVVVWGPELPQPSADPVDLVDVHATVRDLLGLPANGPGRSLLAPLPPREVAPEALLYPEGEPAPTR
jgi:hypothetical protein